MVGAYCQSGTAVGPPERMQRQQQIDALRSRDDGRHHAVGAERRQGRQSARSGSGSSTRRGTGTTIVAALPERNGGRVAGGCIAAGKDAGSLGGGM